MHSDPTSPDPQNSGCRRLVSCHRHPLFPLLALLFEKCEQATQGAEGTTSASFDGDIESFVRKQEKEGKPFFCEDPETDNLVSGWVRGPDQMGLSHLWVPERGDWEL